MIKTRPGLCSVALLFAALLLAPAANAEKVYRWIDENGEVHFGATLPPEYADKPHQILNQAGIVIERIDDPLAKPEPEKKAAKGLKPLFSESEVRFRTDRLLVLRYQSEQDILDAMELEVAQLGYDTRIINQTSESVMNSLSNQVSKVADRQRAGLAVEPEMEKGINVLRQRLKNGQKSLAALVVREEKIRESFKGELERYRFLQSGGKAGSIEDARGGESQFEEGAGSVE